MFSLKITALLLLTYLTTNHRQVESARQMTHITFKCCSYQFIWYTCKTEMFLSLKPKEKQTTLDACVWSGHRINPFCGRYNTFYIVQSLLNLAFTYRRQKNNSGQVETRPITFMRISFTWEKETHHRNPLHTRKTNKGVFVVF